MNFFVIGTVHFRQHLGFLIAKLILVSQKKHEYAIFFLFLRELIRVRVFRIFSYMYMGQGSMPLFERHI